MLRLNPGLCLVTAAVIIGIVRGSAAADATQAQSPTRTGPTAVVPRQPDGDGAIAGVGPDLIVGNLTTVQQYGRSGSKVGLAIGLTGCNKGDQVMQWEGTPSTAHPVFPQNLYRLKDGRFEQIGQAWLKHGFSSANDDECGFGCVDPDDQYLLGIGCSDTYSASTNGNYDFLGSRAWVNPFTGEFPPNAQEHDGHTHNGVSHRLAVEDGDLASSNNPGATYYAEAQCVSPDEYLAGNNSMFNNVSYRRFNVSGSPGGTWTLSSVGATVQEQPALFAWTGSSRTQVEPNPGSDGRAFFAWKVTSIGGNVYRYEYLIYNMNFDRAFSGLRVPLPAAGVHVSNTGFHAPENAPGFVADGTNQDQGYLSNAWIATLQSGLLKWSCLTFSQNQNANAVRWGTLYNFWFDADAPPSNGQVQLDIFKPGSPASVFVDALVPQGAAACEACDVNCDGSVNLFDIAPFVAAISSQNNICSACAADANGDGSLNQFDIAGFVDCLGG